MAGELKEIGSIKEAFHHNLHNSEEMYLVRYSSVEKKSWMAIGEKLEITAEVVEIIKGTKNKGAVITFTRVLDGKYGNISHLNGSLFFVPFYINSDGELEVDSQDPAWITRHTKEFYVLAQNHKK